MAPEDKHAPPLARASEECRLLLEHVSDAVFFVRVSDGRIVVANHAAEVLYGRPRSELLEMRIYDLVAASDGVPVEPEDATRGGLITSEGTLFESVHRRFDGVEVSVEVNARVVELDGENTIIAVVRDITERKATEKALTRAYHEIEQVFETAGDGMRVVDREFMVTRINQTLLDMTGLRREDVLGATCYETFAGENCHTDRCPLTRVLAGEGRMNSEVEKVRPSGEPVTCILTVQPFIVDGEVVGIVESFRDISERKRAEELAQHLATHDALTGLPNRLLFLDRLEVALARARREGTQPALLYCDLDDFKLINDTCGHAVGDCVLRSVGERMKSIVRESDTVARLGGDEFVVLLADVDDEAAAASVAGKLRDALSEPIECAPHTVEVRTSVGLAVYRDGDDVDSLLGKADDSMYRVKRGEKQD